MTDLNDSLAAAATQLKQAQELTPTDLNAAAQSLKGSLDQLMSHVPTDPALDPLVLSFSRPINLIIVDRSALTPAAVQQIAHAAQQLASELVRRQCVHRVCEHMCEKSGACSQIAGVRVIAIDEVRCTAHLAQDCGEVELLSIHAPSFAAAA